MIYKELSLLKISSGHCESNTGHFELQSNALPTELCPVTEQNNLLEAMRFSIGTIPRTRRAATGIEPASGHK